jgi:tetratricopeptide (TPR) repeat protein
VQERLGFRCLDSAPQKLNSLLRGVHLLFQSGKAPTSNRGLAPGKKDDISRAISEFGKAIELAPKFTPAYDSRALAYLYAGSAAQGLADAEKAVQPAPDEASALETRGRVFEALGRREEAIADFKRALAKAPQLQSSKDALKRLNASP